MERRGAAFSDQPEVLGVVFLEPDGIGEKVKSIKKHINTQTVKEH